MGSALKVKIRMFEEYRADFAIYSEHGTLTGDKVSNHREKALRRATSTSVINIQPEQEREIVLHLESSSQNFISITLTIFKPANNTDIVEAKFYTITCVADWMWFLLALDHDLEEYLEIVNAKPDPRDYLPSMVYGGGGGRPI